MRMPTDTHRRRILLPLRLELQRAALRSLRHDKRLQVVRGDDMPAGEAGKPFGGDVGEELVEDIGHLQLRMSIEPKLDTQQLEIATFDSPATSSHPRALPPSPHPRPRQSWARG